MPDTVLQPLHALFTMDCLPPNGPRMIRGPEDWDAARRNMMSFAEALDTEGLVGTLFVCPEALGRLAATCRELVQTKMELGLLSHPQLSNFQSYLGSYGYDREREIIELHKRIWQDNLGGDPVTFRAGFFSASDYTYQIICLLGFQQSSCSLPGRIDPEQCSMWQGACPFPHHTDPLDRKAKGTMEMFEVPVTSDADSREYGDAETFTPPHLRIEDPAINDHAQNLIVRQLERSAQEGVGLRVVNFVTQNAAGWGSAEDPLTERLRNLASLLRQTAQERNLELQPAHLSALHEAADEHWRVAGRD